MEQIGTLLESISRLLPNDVQNELRNNLKTSETIDASPAGAILMGVHILEYLGFSKYIDDILGIEHTTIAKLEDHYNKRTPEEEPIVPNIGIILSLLAADMIACPYT